MNPLPASFLVVAMVLVRRWSRGEPGIGIENVIGLAGMAVTLSVVSTMNRDLGRAFGLLAVVGVALAHIPEITSSAGISASGIKTNTAATNPIKKPGGSI